MFKNPEVNLLQVYTEVSTIRDKVSTMTHWWNIRKMMINNTETWSYAFQSAADIIEGQQEAWQRGQMVANADWEEISQCQADWEEISPYQPPNTPQWSGSRVEDHSRVQKHGNHLCQPQGLGLQGDGHSHTAMQWTMVPFFKEIGWAKCIKQLQF